MKKSMLIVASVLWVAAMLAGCGPAATPVPTAVPPAVPTAVPVVCPTAAPTAVPLVCPTAATAVAPTLVTVIGKIKASPYSLTEDIITAHTTELQYHDPWVGTSGSDVMEKGILLKDLIALVKPTADVKTVALICTDGKEYDVSMADAQQYNIMLSHWVAGTVLDNKTGGPVKVAYPAEAKAYTNDSWAWWVVKVNFK